MDDLIVKQANRSRPIVQDNSIAIHLLLRVLTDPNDDLWIDLLEAELAEEDDGVADKEVAEEEDAEEEKEG